MHNDLSDADKSNVRDIAGMSQVAEEDAVPQSDISLIF